MRVPSENMNRARPETRGGHRSWGKMVAIALSLLVAGGMALAAPGAVQAESGVYKDMVFLLHWVNDTEPAKTIQGYSVRNYFDTTLVFEPVNHSVTASTKFKEDWYQVPVLAGDFRVTSVNLMMWMNASGGQKSAQISASIWEVTDAASNPDGTLVAETNFGNRELFASPHMETFEMTLPSEHTFAAGSSIRILMDITPGTFTYVSLIWDTSTANSRVVLHGPDSIDVTGMTVYDSEMTPTSNLDPATANMTAYIDAHVTDPLGGYDIMWVNLTIFDPLGEAVVDDAPMARITGTDLSFESTYRFSMNYSGLPTGVYEVLIWAVDNNGHNLYYFFGQYNFGDHPATFVGWFSIGVVHWVNFLVEDDIGQPVESAQVMAAQGGEVIRQATTDSSGMINLTLGAGVHEMLVVWRDVTVYEAPYLVSGNVSEDDPVVLSAAIYYPSVQLVDSQGAPVADAAVFLTYPNGESIAEPLWTDDTGTAYLGRSPGGTYTVAAYWKGIEIHRDGLLVSSSTAYVLDVAVYYVTLTVVDSQGIGVEYSHVVAKHMVNRLVLDFGVANKTGTLVTRVPGAQIDFEAYLADVLIGKAVAVDVTQDTSVTIFASMYYVTFTVVDSRGLGLEGAAVLVVSTGDVPIASGTTDEAGQCVLRLPSTELRVSVTWMGVSVYESGLAGPTADGEVTLVATVYYLTLVVSDRDDKPIADAAVYVANLADGEVKAFGYTDAAGTVVLRLPAGQYNLTVRLQMTHLMTEINLVHWSEVVITEDVELSVKFEEYKPPLYATRAFQFGLIIAVLAAALAALLLLPKLRKKAGQ